MHLTLKFIGEIQDIQLPEMCQVLREVAQQHEPFVIRVRGLDAFPHVGAPRTLWAAIVEGQESLTAICSSLDEKLSDFGVRRENRAFRPHITLGRASRVTDPDSLQAELLKLKETDFGDFHVEELHLYSSILDDQGAEYEIMDTGVLGVADNFED